jgi:hypothetical protein
MSTTVTLPGASGTSVSIVFNSSQVASLASNSTNDALALLAQPTVPGLGALFQIYNNSGTTAPNPTYLGGLVISGTGGYFGLLPSGYLTVTDNATGQVVAVNVTTQDTTVYSATGGLAYGNVSGNNTVFLAGGANTIQEEFATSASTVYLDSPVNDWHNGKVTGIDPLLGSATVYAQGGSGVEVFANAGQAVVNVNASAGDVNLVGISNADTIAGTTTSTVTVNATAAGSIVDIAAFGGPAVINPGAANILILAGGSGTETLNAGTGSVTVSSGPKGIFYGGSAGGNLLQSSTVAGSTTLFGGGSGDQLFAFASRTVLNAGPGNETFATNGAASVSGVIFNLGGEASSSSDTLYGSAGGADTVGLGAGTNAVNLYGAGAHSVSLAAAAGTDTLTGFKPGHDIFKLGTASVTSNVYAAGNTSITLSDGTHLTFVGVNMKTSNFS